jgi:peptidoglycan/xylan/chitin deacetylase (PgdA/CDA1 family)
MRIPILTYHSIDETGSPVAVSPVMFHRQMTRLHEAGYQAVPLSEALACSAQSGAPNKRVIALTFDDGYSSVYHHALPVVAAYGWRATVFPVIDFVGVDNAWPGQPSFVPVATLMSWRELSEISALGWEIGAHTRSHPDLTRINDLALMDEVVQARLTLEDRLGQAVRVFAYPYGCHDKRVRATTRMNYDAACTTTMGIATDASDRHALERLDAWYFSQAPTQRLLASPLMGVYAGLCRVARGGRSRASQTKRVLQDVIGVFG